MPTHQDLQSSVHTTSELGNAISGRMLSFLDTVNDQPLGFRNLGLDFLAISQILNTLEQSLSQSAEPFPTPAIPELIKLITKTHEDFVQLKALLERFLNYERGGLYAKMQKTWRMVFADKEIGKCKLALQEEKGGLRMMLVFIKV
jgi:hypothetical protein